MKDYLNPSHYLYKCTIDMFLNDCTNDRYRFIHSPNHKSFNFGITIPMVFTQTSSYSDNELAPQDYDKIMEDAFWKSIFHEKSYNNSIGIYLSSVNYTVLKYFLSKHFNGLLDHDVLSNDDGIFNDLLFSVHLDYDLSTGNISACGFFDYF